MEAEKMFTTKEFAALVQLAEQTIRRRLADGSLYGVKTGDHAQARWRIPASELRRFERQGWRKPVNKEE